MSDSIINVAEYREMFDSIRRTITNGRLHATRAVNTALVETYWAIGKDIVARQREQGWGARVIERLSADLRTACPDMKGLSPRNLAYMASLATRWPDPILQQPAAELPWGHIMILLDKCSTAATSDSTRAEPCRRAGAEACCRP